ncbi:MAG: hypothetical protein Satyrvirus21_16 [Satyrvirus sp.]|uniref:Uncharacterized protein n=1 Tax=Satyrvirus sp. TaxID=2487771 RepID=A0A3G5AEB9_9VIRU|nr:MAG: hypothetical protein Satyrvirus21_16 [Satyrvirus sp.]
MNHCNMNCRPNCCLAYGDRNNQNMCSFRVVLPENSVYRDDKRNLSQIGQNLSVRFPENSVYRDDKRNLSQIGQNLSVRFPENYVYCGDKQNSTFFGQQPAVPKNDNATIYNKLQHLAKDSCVKLSREFSPNDNCDEMEVEYEMQLKLKKERTIMLYKSVLLNMIYGLEYLNNKYNYFNLKLDGWYKMFTSMLYDDESFNEILGAIYDKYQNTSIEIDPRARLMLKVVMNALVCHVLNSVCTFPK